MNVLLTGGTGFIGAPVLDALVAGGHDVTALVRSSRSAAFVRERGAVPLPGDILDLGWYSEVLRGFDGAIHLASPMDHTSAEFDRMAADAAIAAFAGTEKRYVHSSGLAMYGNGMDLREDDPLQPPLYVDWRPEIENSLLRTPDLRVSIVVCSLVYGNACKARSSARFVIDAPRSADGALRMIGTGRQHWVTVHRDDLADLYVRALERGSGRYLAASGDCPTVRELTEVVSLAAGAGGEVVAESDEATVAWCGPLAELLLLDQCATGEKARTELGWDPSHIALIDEIRQGAYHRS